MSTHLHTYDRDTDRHYLKETNMPNALYDPDRIDPIIEHLRSVWKQNPHFRLGQLIVNISSFTDKSDIFYISDKELEIILRRW